MNEYRCTRNHPYQREGCSGKADASARQGYYIVADSEQQAIAKMKRKFPGEIAAGFTVELWRKLDDSHYCENPCW